MVKKIIIILSCLFVISIVTTMVAFFAKTQPLVEGCSVFLTSIVKGEMKKAYAVTSKNFRSKYTPEQFAKLAKELQLNKMGYASWRKREMKKNNGILQGKIVTDVGRKIFLTIKMIKKEEKWIVDSIVHDKNRKK